MPLSPWQSSSRRWWRRSTRRCGRGWPLLSAWSSWLSSEAPRWARSRSTTPQLVSPRSARPGSPCSRRSAPSLSSDAVTTRATEAAPAAAGVFLELPVGYSVTAHYMGEGGEALRLDERMTLTAAALEVAAEDLLTGDRQAGRRSRDEEERFLAGYPERRAAAIREDLRTLPGVRADLSRRLRRRSGSLFRIWIRRAVNWWRWRASSQGRLDPRGRQQPAPRCSPAPTRVGSSIVGCSCRRSARMNSRRPRPRLRQSSSATRSTARPCSTSHSRSTTGPRCR